MTVQIALYESEDFDYTVGSDSNMFPPLIICIISFTATNNMTLDLFWCLFWVLFCYMRRMYGFLTWIVTSNGAIEIVACRT